MNLLDQSADMHTSGLVVGAVARLTRLVTKENP